jgi:polar amino acid transport system substrate-binding protein
VRTALHRAGHSSELKILPWQRALRGVIKSKYDIIPALWFSQTRAETLLFSHAYATNKVIFIKMKGDPFEFNGLHTLDNKVVGLVSKYAYDEEFLAYEGYQKSFTPSILQNSKMLALGRVDLVVADQIVAKEILMNETPKLLEKIEFSHNSLSENKLYLACAKVNPKCEGIIKDFNRELAEMTADGSYQKIMGY